MTKARSRWKLHGRIHGKTCGLQKQENPRKPKLPGANLGGGSSPHSLPQSPTFGAQPRGLAAGSPTPFPAACRGIGLIAGPSRPLRIEIYRMRPLSLVRQAPAGASSPDMVMTRLQSPFASPPFSTRSARNFSRRWPCATGLTSYPSGYFRFTVGWRGFSAAPIRRFCELCQVRPLPELVRRFRAPSRWRGAFW